MRGKKGLLILGLVTLLGFPAIGWAVNYFYEFVDTDTLFDTRIGYLQEIIYGSVFGVLAAAIGWQLVQSPLLRGAYDDIADKIKYFRLTVWDVIFISLCAGIGEEILFRGFIQPVLGIWWTAIIFVAIHGYLRPDQWRKSLYGVYMTLVIAVLGYMREYWGLTSAIAAHTVIDMVLFYYTLKNDTPAGLEENVYPSHPPFREEEE